MLDDQDAHVARADEGEELLVCVGGGACARVGLAVYIDMWRPALE